MVTNWLMNEKNSEQKGTKLTKKVARIVLWSMTIRPANAANPDDSLNLHFPFFTSLPLLPSVQAFFCLAVLVPGFFTAFFFSGATETIFPEAVFLVFAFLATPFFIFVGVVAVLLGTVVMYFFLYG